MITRTYSATIEGMTPTVIEIEIESTQGMPGCIIIGLPSLAVSEAKERITAALASCGVPIKARRTIINLAPADVKKTSSHLELGIAVGILKHYSLISEETEKTLYLGELSLDGTLKPIKGALALVLAAEQFGFSKVVLPLANWPEVHMLTSIQLKPLASLSHLLTGETATIPATNAQTVTPEPSLPHIIGQEHALRAATIAAAGKHNILFLGSPGAGKSVLARSMPALLPELTAAESLEVTGIHSLAGNAHAGLLTAAPFRAPHHTTSLAGLLGGGSPFQPGELTLAHRGVLFLDELPEFARNCLEALREPLETQTVSISRATGKFTVPADTLFVAAANPCPCGHLGSVTQPCRCSPHAQQNYLQKFSGPLLDRIDLHVWVDPVDPALLITGEAGTNPRLYFAKLRTAVSTARALQAARFKNSVYTCNAQILSKDLTHFCPLSHSGKNFLVAAAKKLKLSPRALHTCIKIARTIADLAGDTDISDTALAEAVQYRQQLLPDVLH